MHVVSFADDAAHATKEERAAATIVVRKEAQQLKQRIKVLCLTGDSDLPFEKVGAFARGYARPRMWQQYGDDHRGACLLLSRHLLTGAMAEKVRTAKVGLQGPVKYTDTALHNPRGVSSLSRWDRHCDQRVAVEQHVKSNWQHYFFTKLVDWRSEYEHRLVLLGEAGTAEFLDCGRAITAVVLGHDFPREEKSDATAACAAAGVSLWQITWDGGYPSTEPLGGGSRAAFRLTLETEPLVGGTALD